MSFELALLNQELKREERDLEELEIKVIVTKQRIDKLKEQITQYKIDSSKE